MRKLLVGILAMTMLAGCGRIAEEVAEQAVERGIESDSDADVDLEFGGTDLPEELTIDVPDGFEVLSSSTVSEDDTSFVTALLEYPAGDLDDILAHFESQFESMDAQKVESSSDGNNSWSWYAPDASFTAGVYYVEGDPTLTVTVTQES